MDFNKIVSLFDPIMGIELQPDLVAVRCPKCSIPYSQESFEALKEESKHIILKCVVCHARMDK